MLKRATIGLVLLVPQIAAAADLPRRHHRVHHHLVRGVIDDNHVVRCTTTDWGLVTYANCGQGFDPLSAAAGR